jgi:hypothetical protein
MRTSRKRKANPQYGTSFDSGTAPSPVQHLQRTAMRPDDSLYVAAVISGASIFAWLVAVL